MNRKEGKYKVKFNGEERIAEYVINQDHDSSWCCWWVEGEPSKAWGWSDEDFDSILEYVGD